MAEKKYISVNPQNESVAQVKMTNQGNEFRGTFKIQQDETTKDIKDVFIQGATVNGEPANIINKDGKKVLEIKSSMCFETYRELLDYLNFIGDKAYAGMFVSVTQPEEDQASSYILMEENGNLVPKPLCIIPQELINNLHELGEIYKLEQVAILLNQIVGVLKAMKQG